MKCPSCGDDILKGEYVVKRFVMGGDGKTERGEPTLQHADCLDPKGTYHA